MTHRRLPAFVAIALVLSVLAAARPSQVSACSPDPIAPEERIERFASASTAVVVAEVVAEHAPDGGIGYYRSDLEVVAPLLGRAPQELTLHDLGAPLECGGGHRMHAGDSWLLFLTDDDPLGTRDTERVDWRVVSLGRGAYFLQGGDATLRGALTESPEGEPVGSAEDLIREVGSALGSDEGQVDRAIAYANGDLAPLRAVPPAQEGPNPLAMWGAVAIGLIATSIVVGWYLLGRSRRARRPRDEDRS